MLTSSELSERIRNERILANLSQAQLAAIAGVSISFVRDAETQAGRCTLEKLLLLLTALNLELRFEQPNFLDNI